MFQERKKNDKPIGLHEFLYPLMQGYDSVALDVDLEIGGTDQTFNMLAGRKLLREYKNKEKFVLTTKLLVDPTTNKKIMNKSEGGLVNLDDEPSNMFGKVMALPDTAIVPVAEFSTEMPMDEVRALSEEHNPRDAKLKTAFAVVKTYHGETAAEKAREMWIRTFSEKERPENAPKLNVKNKTLTGIDLLLAAGMESKSEARRLLEQGAVKINDETVSDGTTPFTIKSGDILRIGKHRFFEIE
jgi:tyrosyl-tRNA synthetase